MKRSGLVDVITAMVCSIAITFGIPHGQSQTVPAAAAIEQSSHQPLPTLVRSDGILTQYPTQRLLLRFAIYPAEDAREPQWNEQQIVETGPKGEYSVLLGSASASGLPPELFAAGEPRWLAVSVGDTEISRTLLTTVPYAMKAADANTLAGFAASNFVTQDQLENRFKATAAALAQQAIEPLLSGTVTGSGTAGTVPLWTGTLTQGNSLITQVGSDIGINQTAPTATLDVNGSENVRGLLYLPPLATATSTVGQRSQLLQLSASAWSSSSNAAVTPTFKILTNYVNNNTAGAGGQLEFHYSNGPASVNVFTIAGNGVLTFAPSQTFPGTIGSVAATSPLTATTTSGAVSLGLNATSLESTLNTVYPQLGAYNTFTSGATFGGETTMSGTSGDWMLAVTNESTSSKGTILGQAVGSELGIEGASPGGIGVKGATDTGTGVEASSDNSGTALVASATGSGLAASVVSQNASGPAMEVGNTAGGGGLSAITSTGYAGSFSNISATATLSATNGGTGNAAIFSNNSANYVAVAGENNSTSSTAVSTYGSISNGMAVYGIATAGTGVFGTSTSGNGVYGISQTAYGVVGVSNSGFGVLGSEANLSTSGANFRELTVTAGLWGDTSRNDEEATDDFGVVGTADNAVAGHFQNNSNVWPTLSVDNAGSGGSGEDSPFRTFKASTPNGTCGFGGKGDLSCTGQVKSLVSAGNGARTVETYAMQSPENWMEDFGSGTLERGVAIVKIDPTFADTVSESPDYHVFLTPNGDSKGLYVINKTPTSFEVRESGGGVSYLAFDYRIVAKRRGYESQRHVDVTEQFKTAMDKSPLNSKPKQGSGPASQAPQGATLHPAVVSTP